MILNCYTEAREERNLTALYLCDNYTNYSPLKWWYPSPTLLYQMPGIMMEGLKG